MWLGVCLAIILAAICTVSIAFAGDGNLHAKAKKKKAHKKLTGAELYAINCNRCHPERYATEFTSAQWKTILTHMRVRANLPAVQAREILKYLQEDSGS
jgi:hypothetical protein